MGTATTNISRITIYRVLSIDECIQNKKQQIGKDPWQNCLALILDKISIISLKLLSMVDICLSQIKNKINNNTIVLNSLVLVIVKRDFYQFSLVISKLL